MWHYKEDLKSSIFEFIHFLAQTTLPARYSWLLTHLYKSINLLIKSQNSKRELLGKFFFFVPTIEHNSIDYLYLFKRGNSLNDGLKWNYRKLCSTDTGLNQSLKNFCGRLLLWYYRLETFFWIKETNNGTAWKKNRNSSSYNSRVFQTLI
jgi:hypothetical protein